MKSQDVHQSTGKGSLVIHTGGSCPVAIDLRKGPLKFERSLSSGHRIVVTPSGNDDIAQVLQRLDIGFNTVKDAELCDLALLSRFPTVFLNCSSAAVQHASESGRAPWQRSCRMAARCTLPTGQPPT